MTHGKNAYDVWREVRSWTETGDHIELSSVNQMHLSALETFVNNYSIKISAQSQYQPDQSTPEESRYVFAYTITIENQGSKPARLLDRHWIITDADGKVQEVRGEGVVGEQPHLEPGESFQYTSGAVLPTPLGSMYGSYGMVGDDGTRFAAKIPVFSLTSTRIH